ncbi:hypothetical protein MBLNU457_7215t1 [Dothideomycetes sp. NU457]
MNLGLKESLPSLVKKRFTSAKASQSLVFSQTELAILHSKSRLPFQLRYCPSLAKKPTGKESKDAKPSGPKPDPFENPPAELLVTEVPANDPSHILVLNKFPIIPCHFILATKTNKRQTARLEPDDLAATHACLKAWEGEGRCLFAFFNSGAHSGASQPHRHVQFVPVEEMNRDAPEGAWRPFLDLVHEKGSVVASTKASVELRAVEEIPFQHFVASLPERPSMKKLAEVYDVLYETAEEAVREYVDSRGGGDLKLHPEEGGDLPISYNLAMTTSAIGIVPRRNEAYVLKNDGVNQAGAVALNGTLLAGTLMVKGAAEWEWLRAGEVHQSGTGQGTRLDKVLQAVGIPR